MILMVILLIELKTKIYFRKYGNNFIVFSSSIPPPSPHTILFLLFIYSSSFSTFIPLPSPHLFLHLLIHSFNFSSIPLPSPNPSFHLLLIHSPPFSSSILPPSPQSEKWKLLNWRILEKDANSTETSTTPKL